MDQKELNEWSKHGTVLTQEVKGILLECDTTHSVSTQAYLNELLIALRKRLESGEKITNESTGSILTVAAFDQWIKDEFTSYSSDMYFHSLK